MKIAILSDIHDHIRRLRQALRRVADCDVLLCCGDLCSPFIMSELGGGFEGPIHVVWGNNDGDRFRLTQTAAEYESIHLHGELAELEVDGVRIALHHFDDAGRLLARTGRFDLVCFGHDHRRAVEEVDGAVICNPGEVMGELRGTASCARYDTERRRAEILELSGGESREHE